MKQTDNGSATPASLFLTIDDADMVVNAAIKETSYHNAYMYLIHEFDRVDWDRVPNHTVVEYRFPDRSMIPPLDPGVKNEYHSRDFYYAVDGIGIPRQYIPLPVAYYLFWNNLEMFQPEDVYRRVEQCRGFREFAYRNDRCLTRYPERETKDDAKALAAIRGSGGPGIFQIQVARNSREGWVANQSRKTSPKAENPPAHRDRPRTPAPRRINLHPVPKQTRGRSL